MWTLFRRIADGEPPDACFWKASQCVEFGGYTEPVKHRADELSPTPRHTPRSRGSTPRLHSGAGFGSPNGSIVGLTTPRTGATSRDVISFREDGSVYAESHSLEHGSNNGPHSSHEGSAAFSPRNYSPLRGGRRHAQGGLGDSIEDQLGGRTSGPMARLGSMAATAAEHQRSALAGGPTDLSGGPLGSPRTLPRARPKSSDANSSARQALLPLVGSAEGPSSNAPSTAAPLSRPPATAPPSRPGHGTGEMAASYRSRRVRTAATNMHSSPGSLPPRAELSHQGLEGGISTIRWQQRLQGGPQGTRRARPEENGQLSANWNPASSQLGCSPPAAFEPGIRHRSRLPSNAQGRRVGGVLTTVVIGSPEEGVRQPRAEGRVPLGTMTNGAAQSARRAHNAKPTLQMSSIRPPASSPQGLALTRAAAAAHHSVFSPYGLTPANGAVGGRQQRRMMQAW